MDVLCLCVGVFAKPSTVVEGTSVTVRTDCAGKPREDYTRSITIINLTDVLKTTLPSSGFHRRGCNQPPPSPPKHTTLPTSKLPPNIHLGKPLRLRPQHIRNLPLTHPNLRAHRHKALCQVRIVLHKQADGQHDVINVAKHESVLVGVTLLLLEEGYWVFAPVAARV